MGQAFQVLCVLCAIALIVAIGVAIYFGQDYLSRRAKKFDKAIKKCDEYVKFACNVGNTLEGEKQSGNVLGGQDAAEGEFPHMAYLSIKTDDNKEVSCGGTLISDQYILTSGRCVQNTKNEGITVKLGTVYRTSPNKGTLFKVDQIKIHHSFKQDSGTYLNDIALLKLTKAVKFSLIMRPICLATYVGFKSMDSASICGWGLDNSGKLSDRLKKLKAFIGTGVQSECEGKWGNHFGYYQEMICAGHPRFDKGLCQGDLGGPLQLMYESLSQDCPYVYEQLGIASMNNHECSFNTTTNETYVTAYTRIQEYIPWIVDIVWPQ